MSDYLEWNTQSERLKVNSIGDVFDNLLRLADSNSMVKFTKGGMKSEYPLWKDDLGNASVVNRITKFMGDERGIAYIPRGGDQIALRESIVASVFNTSKKIDGFVIKFSGDIAKVKNHEEIDNTGNPVRITADPKTGYITDLILDIKVLSGQDEYNPKDGLRISQIEPVLAACKVNEETCRREYQGVGMEKLVPTITIIDSESQYRDVNVGIKLLQKNSVI